MTAPVRIHAPARSGRWLVLLATLALSACANLLPRSRSDDVSSFPTFEAARDGVARIEPYRSSSAELKALGFDTAGSTNVREIAYPQLVARLFENPFLSLAEIDAGIRECIGLRERCRAYEFRFSRLVRERQGDFLLDFLNFHRVTRTSGWRFEAIVLVRSDGIVLFRNHGGEPRIEATEDVRNPLGPLQSFDSVIR